MKEKIPMRGTLRIYEGDRLVYEGRNTIVDGAKHTATQMSTHDLLNNITADGLTDLGVGAMPTAIHVTDSTNLVHRWCPIQENKISAESVLYTARLYAGDLGGGTVALGNIRLGCHTIWNKTSIQGAVIPFPFICNSVYFVGQPSILVVSCDKAGGENYGPYYFKQLIDYGIGVDTGFDYRIDTASDPNEGNINAWRFNINSAYKYQTTCGYYIVNGGKAFTLLTADVDGYNWREFSSKDLLGAVTVDNEHYDVLFVWEIEYG